MFAIISSFLVSCITEIHGKIFFLFGSLIFQNCYLTKISAENCQKAIRRGTKPFFHWKPIKKKKCFSEMKVWSEFLSRWNITHLTIEKDHWYVTTYSSNGNKTKHKFLYLWHNWNVRHLLLLALWFVLKISSQLLSIPLHLEYLKLFINRVVIELTYVLEHL